MIFNSIYKPFSFLAVLLLLALATSTHAETPKPALVMSNALTGCAPYTEDDKILKITKDENFSIKNFNCSLNNSSISAFAWQWKKSNHTIASGIFKTTEDTSGMVGSDFEWLSNQTLVINEMSERGGTYNLINFSNKHKPIILSFDYGSGDDDGLCAKALTKDSIAVQRCYWQDNKTKYFGDVLKIKIGSTKMSVINPKIFETFTNWDKMPRPKNYYM